MGNTNLSRARREKNDEFYTQYPDVENEMFAYHDFNEDVFRGKTILLPCDDPESSSFTQFFAANFMRLGLRKLIGTSYAPAAAARGEEDRDPRGRMFVLEKDMNGDGVINKEDIVSSRLEGDGDFRSAEVTALRDEADIIITNPPFSLFREFLAWIMAGNKRFSIVANKNCVTFKEVFPLIKEGVIWSGKKTWSSFKFKIPNSNVLSSIPAIWITNIDHGRRHERLSLMSASENLRNNPKMKDKSSYDDYDNFGAIDVPFTDAIPNDHDGLMGVPISFLGKHCLEQFEIIGSFNAGVHGEEIGARSTPILVNGKIKQWNGPVINKKPQYKRIIIRIKRKAQ